MLEKKIGGMIMIRQLDLTEVYEKNTVGKPSTPGNWVDSTPTYREVTRLRMTCGGGMGGAQWYEVIERIDLNDLMQRDYLVTRNWLGEEIGINLRYVVDAKQFTLATAKYDSQNPNFKQLLGVSEYNWLIKDGDTITLVDDFQMWNK